MLCRSAIFLRFLFLLFGPVLSCLVLSRLVTLSQVTGHKGAEEMATALEGADIVVIPAGVPRKPGMTR